MATESSSLSDLNQDKYDGDEHIKIICLGDSAVGKSKCHTAIHSGIMFRENGGHENENRLLSQVDGKVPNGRIVSFLSSVQNDKVTLLLKVACQILKENRPQQLSTYALTLYKYTTTVNEKTVLVDFWDTAGQERFQSMHPSYYHKAHACIMVFDVQRKITYKNLNNWYKELRESRPEIPCVVVANKIDADLKITQKSFNFAKKQGLPFYFVSAADGTNVVKLFRDTIKLAVSYKQNTSDFMDEVMRELENFDLEAKENTAAKNDDQSKEEKPQSP